ncbi:hypothetical protein EMB92_08250 [Bifidobacterium callitrichos]|uniref:Uncharacterized protein n=1 Tax=Bifidobacterium callitrichos TaxID=762209 RepID=A0A5M9ZBU8_9BIFI|nr:hypothetical protein [Bifidobacterium callitrichos]KAA8815928.1 hypothetical protein EMB92_08250 [Bifidobacterium callitrichos]
MKYADNSTKANRKTSLGRKVVYAAVAFVVAAAIAVGLILTGVIPMRRGSAGLPCDDLTSYQSTQDAYDTHRSTIDSIKAVGKGVSITVKHADCPTASQDEGYLEITYRDEDERNAIMKILDQAELGIYASLVQSGGAGLF